VLASNAFVVDAIRHVVRHGTRRSRSPRVRCCSRSRVRWAKRGRETHRGTRSSRAHSDRSSPMNRIAPGCESK